MPDPLTAIRQRLAPDVAKGFTYPVHVTPQEVERLLAIAEAAEKVSKASSEIGKALALGSLDRALAALGQDTPPTEGAA